LEGFHLQYRSLKESAELLPQPMEGIIAVVNETVQSFNSEYNFGKEVGKDILTYCRPAVERYVFSKLYDNLFAMYAIKNQADDRKFTERQAVIKRMKEESIMQYLGIKQKFILGRKATKSLNMS
jgi:hypothetical protein